MNPGHRPSPSILMLLSNAFDPDPRVHNEGRVLVRNGYKVTILCWDRDRLRPPVEFVDGIRVERIYVRSTHGRGVSQIFFLGMFWMLALARAVTMRYQVVHCHDFDTLPLGVVLSIFKRVKLVYDAHESYADMLENVPKWIPLCIVALENWCLRRVDCVITVGDILAKAFRRRGAKRTVVVGNWKEPRDFVFPAEILHKERETLGIPRDQVVVSFIGNLGLERQIAPLVEAVRGISKLTLLVGGKGPAESIVRRAAEESKNIVYLGFVHPSKVPLYTALSDMLFYGFDPMNKNARFSAPNKLFEGIACGRGLITGNFGEIGAMVRRYNLGRVVEAYTPECIRRAIWELADPSVSDEVSSNCQKAAKIFNWSTASRRLLEAYNALGLSCS